MVLLNMLHLANQSELTTKTVECLLLWTESGK